MVTCSSGSKAAVAESKASRVLIFTLLIAKSRSFDNGGAVGFGGTIPETSADEFEPTERIINPSGLSLGLIATRAKTTNISNVITLQFFANFFILYFMLVAVFLLYI